MNAVIDRPNASKARSKTATPTKPVPVGKSPMLEIDALVQPIAHRINPLAMVFANWPWSGDFPGRDDLVEVDNLLTDLGRPLEDWDLPGEPARPMTGSVLLKLVAHLQGALLEIEDAQDHNPGQRCLLLLVARETLNQVQALERVFAEACLGQLGGLKAMAEEAGGQPMTVSIPREITAKTKLQEAPEAATNIIIRCSHDIETLAEQVTLLADECAHDGDSQRAALLRCYGTRIGALNSNIMSFLSDDPAIKMGDVHRSLYYLAKSFEGGDYV